MYGRKRLIDVDARVSKAWEKKPPQIAYSISGWLKENIEEWMHSGKTVSVFKKEK